MTRASISGCGETGNHLDFVLLLALDKLCLGEEEKKRTLVREMLGVYSHKLDFRLIILNLIAGQLKSG